MKKEYIVPSIFIEQIEDEVVICTTSSASITATAPDMESGQPCGCDCPCDENPPCHCLGCSPNDSCVFFDGPCL